MFLLFSWTIERVSNKVQSTELKLFLDWFSYPWSAAS
ncbi:hypothetical protein GLYMA_19G066001v4 [Glycine max]|nr:hypothetical protein GLYMA_19G066001v4 [Glycine max]KAH1076686.1 hypothetical protein GYH30_052269 [Glycine max]